LQLSAGKLFGLEEERLTADIGQHR
jgi:hypothetical protein